MSTIHRFILTCCFLLAGLFTAHAATIEGVVRDLQTGAPLQGANVLLEGTELGAVTDSNGFFRLPPLPSDDRYLISASYVGYRVAKQRVTIGDTKLQVKFNLQPILLSGEEVVYVAGRARPGKTPASFTNLTADQIRERYWAQDLPPLLETLPGVHAYSETGTGIGYSYLKVRGFDQKRIGVTVNGIPMNDPEDGTVYWVDTPDLASNLQDAQLQRGVSYSASNSGGFGGSLNLVTLTPGLEDPNLSVNIGAGSFGTRKWGMTYNSGIIKNTYGFYGRYSQIESDGYRDNSSARLYSYFLSAIRYGERSMWTANVYGGREITHAAWDASPESAIRSNRRHNPIDYENTVDDFTQPRYELHHRLDLASNLTFEGSLFYVRGEGYYEQFKGGRDLVDFGFAYYPGPDGTDIEKSDVVNQKWVEKDHYGYLPRLTWERENSVTQIGGDIQFYQGNHYGFVIWGEALPPMSKPKHEYYRYDGHVQLGGLFVTHYQHLSEKVGLEAQLEGRSQHFSFAQKNSGNFSGDELNKFDVGYLFVNPKLGLHYSIDSGWDLFSSVGMSHRAPTNDEYWDTWDGPDDLGVDPLFATSDTIRTASGAVRHVNWKNPTIDPERVIDFELGSRWTSNELSLNVNGYWMIFRNEIIPAGGVRDGSPVTDNATASVHRGIEIEAGYRPRVGLQLWSNLSFSDDRLLDYTLFDYDSNYDTIPVNLDGKRIALFPSMLSYSGIGFNTTRIRAFMDGRYVGRQYLDNREMKEHSIEPYFLLGLNLGVDLQSFPTTALWQLSLRVNNLLDTAYETSGWYDPWAGENFYFVGASRNFFVGLSARF